MSGIRTPPSLKWLIDKRARLHGEIEKLEKSLPVRLTKAKKELKEAQASLEQAKQHLACQEAIGDKILVTLHKDLAAIDSVLGLHKIQINPEIIPPIHTPDAAKLLPYGELTRSIFDCLKCAGGGPLTTLEIAIVIASNNGLDMSGDNFQAFRKKVLWRLKGLCAKGKIERLHQVKGSIVGKWVLPSDPMLPIPEWKPKVTRPRA